MGGLGRFLEEEGLATVSISLIREHTERIKPPRALWVPFDLGRPLGPPHDSAFQRRVLLAALRLLEAPAGPVLADFPEDEPPQPASAGPLACPVSFAPTAVTALDQLTAAFRAEAASLASWHNLARQRRGRSAAVSSGLDIDQVVDLLAVWALGSPPPNPRPELPLGQVLKLAAEDLKAFYFEALTAQPGCARGPRELNDWFWQTTAAAQVFKALKEICVHSEDKLIKLMGDLCLVPRRVAG